MVVWRSTAPTHLSPGRRDLRVGTADAIFEPLAARQVLAARRIDTQTARNEALEITAESYFNVQMSARHLRGDDRRYQ